MPQSLHRTYGHIVFSTKNRDAFWFSVSPQDVETAAESIQHQKEHHRVTTFQEEYRKFLQRYGVDYDERSVWD